MAVEYPRRAVIVEGLAAPRGQRRARRREDLGRAAKAVVPLKDALREVWTGGLGDITTLYLGNFVRLIFAETCEKASSSSVSNEVTTRYEPTCERHVSHGLVFSAISLGEIPRRSGYSSSRWRLVAHVHCVEHVNRFLGRRIRHRLCLCRPSASGAFLDYFPASGDLGYFSTDARAPL